MQEVQEYPMPSEGFIHSAGVKLHYLDWGGSGTTIVLLAGLGDTAQMYRGLGAKLTKDFRVVGLTRRGHGRSDRPDSGYDLATLVEDISRFLEAMGIARTALVGHSFAGLEMPRLALCSPESVSAIVYLDALFPKLNPEHDLSGDPVWAVLPSRLSDQDLASRETYLAYHRRAWPAWSALWCEAIEADLLDKVIIRDDGQVENHHDDELMNSIYGAVLSTRNPEYGKVEAPMLAIVPDGSYHQSVPIDAADELRKAADEFWVRKTLPWIRQRTETFRQAVPAAQVITIDSPYHHIFLAEEDKVMKAITHFMTKADSSRK
jgi:pimeloyl-ACP methyl ester carboxylesterase